MTIETGAGAAPLMICADRQRLKQALMIVLDNAVKYSEVGGVVTVDLKHDETQAELMVRNRGLDIAPEDRPYVFDRFYRGAEHRPRKAAGSDCRSPNG